MGHSYKTAISELIWSVTNIKEIEFCNLEELSGDYVISRFFYDEKDCYIETVIALDGKIHKASYGFNRPINFHKDIQISNAVKMSYYLLAKEVYSITLPWGIMTGIRPAKIAMTYMQGDKSKAQTIEHLQKRYMALPQKARLATEVAIRETDIIKKARPNGISLYIGIPFCPTRCLYCSFVAASIAHHGRYIAPYIDALINEIELTGAIIKDLGLVVDTVYIGGGTPTTLEAEQLNRLIGALYNSFDLTSSLEFTVEAGRPDTITQAKLQALKNNGVTRISINPQTVNPKTLRLIGRDHTTEQFYESYDLALKCGLNNINTDLIAGLPGEDANMFLNSLKRVMELSPQAITIHALSIKRAAYLKYQKENMPIPPLSEADKMIDGAAEQLINSRYIPYYLYRQKDIYGSLENCGYAKVGFEGIYNVLIMEEAQSIIALGAGGVTKLVNNKTGRIERIFNLKNAPEYISRFETTIVERKHEIKTMMQEMGML